MKRTKPPFRADHVGSFLRSAAITEARAKREKGQISAADLKKVEDQEIPKVIKKQEEVGLQCATDGEYRRMFWHFDFYDGLDGVEIYELDHGIQFQGMQTKPKSIRVNGKIDFSNHPMLEHFKFVKANTKVMPKMCIPAPTVMHFRLEPGAVDKKFYPSRDAIFDDLAAAYRKAVKAFYDAGCRYLQFDDTAWAYLCSDVEMKKAKDRGMNVATLADDYTTLINKSLEGQAGRHGDHHACLPRQLPLDLDRVGRLRAGRRAAARPVQLRRLFPRIRQRARRRLRAAALPAEGQEDRRGRRHHVEERHAGEARTTVKRRIDEAAKFAPLEQLALSPQCGFASTEEGNILTEEQQWAKMREVVEIARRGVGEVVVLRASRRHRRA